MLLWTVSINKMDFKKMTQKTIFITGATGGIGRATTFKFASLGYALVLVDLTQESLNVLKAELKQAGVTSITTFAVDLSQADAVSSLCDHVLNLPKLDVAFINAGIVIPKALVETSHQEIDAQLAINLTSAIHLTKTVAGKMLADKQAGKITKGNIIATVSMGGIIPLENASIYAATKFGLRGFLCALAQELSPQNIKVTGIYPSAVDTPMLRHEAVHGGNVLNFLGKPLTAEVIAELVAKAVDTGKLSLYAPYSDSVLSRMVNFSPWLMLRVTKPLYWLGEKGRQKYLKALDASKS